MPEVQAMYLNHYHCGRCGCEWEDQWDSRCDDRCPECNAPTSPYASDDLEGGFDPTEVENYKQWLLENLTGPAKAQVERNLSLKDWLGQIDPEGLVEVPASLSGSGNPVPGYFPDLAPR